MKIVVTGLSLLAVCSVAHAGPDAAITGGAGDRSHASATVGIATPVGQAGIEGTLVLHHNFELGVGVGLANIVNLGDTGKPDPQLAIMPRFRLPVGPLQLTVGAGLSGGQYTVGASPFSSDPFLAKTTALWANGEVGVEYFSHDGTFGGAYVGGGKVIAHGDVMDGRGALRMTLPDDALPYLGIKIGHSF